MSNQNRRSFLKVGGLAGSALILGACAKGATNGSNQNIASNANATTSEKPQEKEVTTLEDLMREHGELRRALLVYSSAAMRLRRNPGDVSPDALQKTAKLFRAFGEEYHEQKLEEQYIFPLVKQNGAT